MNANSYVQGLAVESVQHEQLMLQLADTMASTAVGFNSAHGYDAFIDARNLFHKTLHEYYEDIRNIAAQFHRDMPVT